jgi:histone-lysine N-methyltransferase MLL3
LTECNNSSDKKKRTIRKKQKNKLVETYPGYLQEAFFGKCLLDVTKPVKLEFISDEEDTKSNVSDDKTIKLSAEELKIIHAIRIQNEKVHNDDSKNAKDPNIEKEIDNI